MEIQKANLIRLIQKNDPEIKHIEIIPDYEGVKYWNEVGKIRAVDFLLKEEINEQVKSLFKD
jgi:hypothetical protein